LGARQGRPEGKAAQALVLGLTKKIIFLKPIRPQNKIEFNIYRPPSGNKHVDDLAQMVRARAFFGKVVGSILLASNFGLFS
jgi:hypothetical protein